MSSDNSNKVSNILGLVFWIYGIMSQIMAVYFWWQYSKEDGFIMAITIDVLLAEIKGIFWIFFI